MALFFEYPTSLVQKPRGQVICGAWSQTNAEHPIFAVATKNGIVFYHEEGEHIEPDVVLNREASEATLMMWHPIHTMVAIGWADGTVSLWTEKERVLREDNSVHKTPITYLGWSPEGTRLVTGDQTGTVGVWSADARGKLVLVAKYAKSGAITHCCFRAPAVIKPADLAQITTCPPFFFGGIAGVICFADDTGRCSEVINLGAPVNCMYYSPAKDYLVIITVDVVLYKYRISADYKLTNERKVKLSIKGDGSELECVWAGSGLLAAANGEPMVRFWSMESDENYVLSIADPRHNSAPKDIVRCLSFNPRKRVLAAGTVAGRVCMWHYIGPKEDMDPSEDDWEILPSIDTQKSVFSMNWGPGEGLLGICSKEMASILNETVLHCKTHASGAVIQMSSDRLFLSAADGKSKKLSTAIRIKGMDVNGQYIIVWNGKKAEVREQKEGSVGVVSSFATRAKAMVLHGDDIYQAVPGRVEVLNLQGVVKKALSFTEVEGNPLHLDACGDYIACATSTGRIMLWNVERAETKQIVPGRMMEECHGMIRSIRVNCTGSKLSIIASRIDEVSGLPVPDEKLWFYDVELDRVFSHDFGPNYYPHGHHWDNTEPKLVAVESKKIERPRVEKKDEKVATEEKKEEKKQPLSTAAASKAEREAKEKREKEEKDAKEEKDKAKMEGYEEEGEVKTEGSPRMADSEVTTLFATSEGILMQDSFAIEVQGESMMGLEVPFIFFMSRPTDDPNFAGDTVPRVKKRSLRDFVGLEKVPLETQKDLMNFSYHLTVGNMDEAYRAVKKISSETIWENMATMCVKTKRLDVAEVCLGNMNNARGARAVREAKKLEKDAQVAMLAIQLGLPEDAERLYKSCGRYDLLTKFYMACGRWKDALKVCAKFDRIHLKTTHYLYAKHLESTGDTAAAIKNYEKSETHKHEVPRMLFDAQHIADLETYIKSSDDPQLFKWWAQYCESNSQFDDAVKYYELARETLALVRVHCYQGEVQRAAEICKETGDLAACYHLARQYEEQGMIKEAISFFTRAKRFNHGIRLAKEHMLETELMTLALEGTKEGKVEAAKYFEEKGVMDKAVLLYQKGGRIGKALDLCFKAQLFDALRTISENLGPDTDPAVLAKCGDFFLQNGHFEKAVHLFIGARAYNKALDLCIKHDVKITEGMAESLTPPKIEKPGDSKDPATDGEAKTPRQAPVVGPDGKEMTNEQRQAILLRLAQACHDQRSYHLACKKYTQAGDQVKAIRCLTKSDDNEKIIYYATKARNREVYILAANHLTGLQWHTDPNIMKTIIDFYTKARAMEQLSSFYSQCASAEIDEYRDYEKALTALQESLKFMIKAKAGEKKEAALADLDGKIRLVTKFVEARKLVKKNPAEMIKLCSQLLDQPDIESAIRVGDVFALMVEYYHSQRQYPQAYDIIGRMNRANIVLSPYLDAGMLKTIYQAMGVDPNATGGDGGGDDDIPDEIQEE